MDAGREQRIRRTQRIYSARTHPIQHQATPVNPKNQNSNEGKSQKAQKGFVTFKIFLFQVSIV
jgi:hypothetical protein